MAPSLPEGATFERLNSAKAELARILPPQAAKILSALQHVEIALQYYTIDSLSTEALRATRAALRALNQIEKRHELPPPVSFAVNQATCELANILKTSRAQQAV